MMRVVISEQREFALDAYFVVIGSANAIRGLAVGEPVLAVGGLILMALVLTDLLFEPVLGRLVMRLFRRAPGKWTRRALVAFFVIAVVTDGIHAVTSATRADWGTCFFYALRMAAGAGVLICIAPMLSPSIGVGRVGEET